MFQSIVMLDDVSVRVWILFAIAIAAYGPALYIFRYLTDTPLRRDITSAPKDYGWRSVAQFRRNFFILAGLISLSLFIFTPTADAFARSPSFWPLLIVLMGLWAASTIVSAFRKGRIQPIVRGVDWTFERKSQPKRFWAALLWNGTLGGLCISMGAIGVRDAPVQQEREKCHNYQDRFSAVEAIEACNALLKGANGRAQRSDILLARGNGHYDQKNYILAERDYAASANLDPESSAVWYNLGLVSTKLGNRSASIRHYGQAITKDNKNGEAFLNRGLLFLDDGELDRAIADFTEAANLEPENATALANRGIAYVWKRDTQKALVDFQKVDAIDRSNVIVLHGRALLSLHGGNPHAAIEQLSAAIGHDPDDLWALRLRGDIYESLGDYARSQADTDRVLKINRGMTSKS